VDDPKHALGVADQLAEEVMRTRGTRPLLRIIVRPTTSLFVTSEQPPQAYSHPALWLHLPRQRDIQHRAGCFA